MKTIIPLLMILLQSSWAFSSNLINRYDTDHGFSISFPFGWEAVPDNILKKFPSDVTYQYGYQENPGDLWFQTYPYMLIHVNNSERLTESAIRDTDKISNDMDTSLERYIYANNMPIKEHHIETIYYREENRTLHSILVMTHNDTSTVKVLSAMTLTAKGYISMMCFLDDSKVDQDTSLFEEIIDNVRLDDNMVFTPRFSDHFIFFEKWKKNFFSSPQNGFIVLFLCLGIWWSRNKIFGIK